MLYILYIANSEYIESIEKADSDLSAFLHLEKKNMINEELNTALYRKIYKEQAAFRAQLLGMTL